MERLAVLIFASMMALAACSNGTLTNTAGETQHRTMVVNNEPTPICLAVAGTIGQQVNGLAHRPSLPPNEGMAFPFATVGDETFNMKDTAFPLSIVWVGPNSQVLGSTNMAADSTDQFPSPAPVTMAVELSPQDWAPLAGTARTLSLGQACNGTITAGRPGQAPSQF